ncbi:hypothetical protein [Clostridium saccharoperbutylacetonicum]|uniref:hypothetical protein n=1 Tax=Clostridium saccharoperbutylacetonicum TaxID=36745 RepID=UPI000983C62A|nr:hypothetical protein [Clostridium saccharoperbutylacetonicum]AQR98090.1 hypothetical protein CLSAP_54410 [Clostridium saccharoperbutylacetonicum]NSB33983.1 cob(I)alamin adenosyltransferase [Clostridium saccharoperbutylacetonicum]
MIKAKDIRSMKESIIKYKTVLDKETNPLQIFIIKSKIKEQQYRLMDVESQLFNIEIYLYKDAQLHKEIFIDKYINGLTLNQLVIKYNMERTTIYRFLSADRKIFERYLYKVSPFLFMAALIISNTDKL